MPRSRSAPIALWYGDDHVRVTAKPRGWRGKWWLSWLPYRTGDEFTADVTVTVIKSSGQRQLVASWKLREPTGSDIEVRYDEGFALPLNTHTRPIFLATSGEYVLGVGLATLGRMSQDSGFTRGLITFKVVSQDDVVANVGVSLVTAASVFVLGTLVTRLF